MKLCWIIYLAVSSLQFKLRGKETLLFIYGKLHKQRKQLLIFNTIFFGDKLVTSWLQYTLLCVARVLSLFGSRLNQVLWSYQETTFLMVILYLWLIISFWIRGECGAAFSYLFQASTDVHGHTHRCAGCACLFST